MIKAAVKKSIIEVLGGNITSAVFAPLRKDIVPVFTLHRVEAADQGVDGYSVAFMEEALRYLIQKNYSLCSFAELMQSIDDGVPMPKNAVVFTCDDGFWDQAEITAPLLDKYHCPLTIFLISGFLDGNLWPWDDRLRYIFRETKQTGIAIKVGGQSLSYTLGSKQSRTAALRSCRQRLKECDREECSRAMHDLQDIADVDVSASPPEFYRPMSWDQARSLEKKNVRFAPHSVTHSIMSRSSNEKAEHEITQSWTRLNEELDNALPVFCYPTGRATDFGMRDMEIVANAGLDFAVTTIPGYVNVKRDTVFDRRYSLRRFSFPDNMADLIQSVSWIERLKQLIRHEK